jgi:multidrug efflux system membrane fusion protein
MTIRNGNQVLIVDAENRLRFRDIELYRFDQDSVLIKSGLQVGELVNISPIQTVIDGMRVKPIQQDNKGA